MTEESTVGYCPKCIDGDHSNHHPALGGICIGCACPEGGWTA